MKINYILPIFIEGSFSLKQGITICALPVQQGDLFPEGVSQEHTYTHASSAFRDVYFVG